MKLAELCGCNLQGTCRLCVLAHADKQYAELFGMPEPKPGALIRPRLAPVSVVKIPSETYIPKAEGLAFNASLIRWRGQLLLAHRTGWAGCEVRVIPVDDNYRPIGPSVQLDLLHGAATFGREDPRLFVFRGRLHVSYTGFTGSVTSVLYARLRDDLTTEAICAPHYSGRRAWEKNWSFFEEENELYAVYSIDPHVVLRIDGDTATVATQSPTNFPWHGGHLRGGASPVLVRGEWYHWFHGAIDLGQEWPTRQYNTGLYTFMPRTHRVLRLPEHPLAWADHGTRPADQYCSVQFAGGAVLDGDLWRVSCGTHDRWIEVMEYRHADVQRWLGVPTRTECLHLGQRTEFREGCSGWTCRHECDAGEPEAVPGGVCQSCSKWEI